MSCQNYQSGRGFTLLELLIAMAIVSILATIAVPSYRNYIIKSEIKTAQADLVALSAAIENRFQRRLRYPVAALASTSAVNGEFSTWMASTKKFTFSYSYSAGEYTITAKGNSDVGGCTLTLKGDNTTTASDCISTKSSWI